MKSRIHLLFLICICFFSDGLSQGFDPDFRVEIYRPGAAEHLAKLSDGRFVVAGRFSFANQVEYNRLARFLPDGQLDNSFQPPLRSSTIKALAVDEEGKTLIAGNIRLNDNSTAGLLRLLEDGSLDPSFQIEVEAASNIITLAIREDGKILIGGFFTELGEEATQGLLLLNADGTIAQSWQAHPGEFMIIQDLIPLENNRMLVAGSKAGEAYLNILSEDLSVSDEINLDTELEDINYLTSVNEVLYLPNGNLYISGTTFFLQNYIAILSPEGARLHYKEFSNNITALGYTSTGEPLFARQEGQGYLQLYKPEEDEVSFYTGPIGASGIIYQILTNPDGSLLVGTSADRFEDVPIDGIALIDPEGTPVADYPAGLQFHGIVNDIEIQADGKILIGGYFNTILDHKINSLARLLPDGSPDESFQQQSFAFQHQVNEILLYPDGKILTSGENTSLVGGNLPSINRFETDGSLDESFITTPAPFGQVAGSLLLPNQSIFSYGSFGVQTDQGIRENIALYSSTGELMADTFAYLSSEIITSVIPLEEGSYLLAGRKLKINGVNQPDIIKLTDELLPDPGFSLFPGLGGNDATFYHLKQQDDGNIVVIGKFSVEDNEDEDYGMARLDNTGNWVNNFECNMQYLEELVAPNYFLLLPDNRTLIAGIFDTINNFPAKNLAILEQDGSLNDTLYFPIAGGQPFTLEALTDSTVLVGGSFWMEGDPEHSALARINLYEPMEEDTMVIVAADIVDESMDLEVYPNPSTGVFTFRLSSKITGPVAITIFNTHGQRIFRQIYVKQEKDFTQNIDLSDQADGVYFIMLTSPETDKNKVGKVILRRE